MSIIDIGNNRVKLIPSTGKVIMDTRTLATFSEVICKTTEVKYYTAVDA